MLFCPVLLRLYTTSPATLHLVFPYNNTFDFPGRLRPTNYILLFSTPDPDALASHTHSPLLVAAPVRTYCPDVPHFSTNWVVEGR